MTDRDIVLKGASICGDPEEALIENIMSTDILTIRKNAGIFDAIQEMKSTGVRGMPIVDFAGRLVGLLTADDLIRLLAREMSDIARITGKESLPI